MTQTLTLRQLGERVGVDVTQLKRLVRVGALPEASKEIRPEGNTWVVPEDALSAIASRHGWAIGGIDLRDDLNPKASLTQATVPHETVPQKQVPKPAVLKAPPTARQASEVTAESIALVPHGQNGAVVPHGQPPLPPESSKITRGLSVAELIDQDLLNRLLGAHEEKAEARARIRETERALTNAESNHQIVARRLTDEQHDRLRTEERLREERSARLIADAKLIEVRERMARELTLAETERRARSAAVDRSLRAERDAATAVASMSWLSRRRYARSSESRS